MEKLVEKAKKLIDNIRYITIASVTPDGNPWNSPVHAVHDEKYNFIWNSSAEAQHSKNIKANSKVFIVIYDSSPEIPEAFGVYLEAEAKEVTEKEELERIIKVFYEKKGKIPSSTSEFLEPSLRRMYIAIPKKVSVNQFEKGKMPPDSKVEIKLI